jgi:hypothetical protein
MTDVTPTPFANEALNQERGKGPAPLFSAGWKKRKLAKKRTKFASINPLLQNGHAHSFL